MSAAAPAPVPAAAPRLPPLAGPLFVEVMLVMAVGLLGTLLAARLGDAPAAAFALCAQVTAMLFVLFRVVGAGVGVVVAQALGGQRRAAADAAALAALGAASWSGGACALLALLGAGPLLRALNTPPEVLPLAQPLLQWLAPAVLLDAWNNTLSSVLRAHLHARPTLWVNALIQVLHGALAWPLMLGVAGLAEGAGLGLTGYALALLAARGLGLALLLQAWRQRLGLRPAAADWRHWRGATLAPVVHIGWPGAVEHGVWRLGFMVSLSVVGALGASALATQAYVMQLTQGILLCGFVIGLSAEVVVGHLIGAGRLHAAHRLVRRVLAWGLALALGLSLAAALGGRWLLGWFTDDPAIVAQGVRLLWLAVALETGRVFNLVLLNALRAAGDARFPMWAGLPVVALVMAGGSLWLGGPAGLGLAGVWLACAADEWLRGLLSWWRWARLGWVPAARGLRRRLRPRRGVA